jgi:hypothetical protein
MLRGISSTALRLRAGWCRGSKAWSGIVARASTRLRVPTAARQPPTVSSHVARGTTSVLASPPNKVRTVSARSRRAKAKDEATNAKAGSYNTIAMTTPSPAQMA